MGGELQISSEESGGSAFSFEIDALKCCSSPQHLQNEEVIEDTLVKAVPDSNEQNVFNILVAEDYEVNRMFIGMLLNSYSDLTYDFAINGEEALSLLDTNAYDLILMDINMPVMNGCDATRIIRQELKLDIPIIALTANALDGDRKRFLETGMNDYLAKPLDISDMDRIMNTYRHP
jgi:CheY-like chemotaxis protein